MDVILCAGAKLKLEVTSFLITNKTAAISTRKLSTHFNCSHSKMQTMIGEIVHDLEECCSEPVLEVTDKIQLIKEDFQNSVYQQYLIRQSMAYKLIFCSLMEPGKNLKAFCEDKFLSQATVTRFAQPLMLYLKKFDIRLNLSQLKWTGSEAMIRLVFFNLLWLGSHGTDLLDFGYDYAKEEKLIEDLGLANLDYINEKEVFLTLIIARLRTEQGHTLPETPFKNLTLPEADTKLTQYLTSYITDDLQLTRQREYLIYMIFYAPYCLSEKDERVDYLEKYFQNLQESGDGLAILIDEFVTYYQRKLLNFDMDENTLRLLRINIVKTFLNFSIRKGAIPLSVDFFRELLVYNNHLFKEVAQQVNLFLKKVSRRKNFTWINQCLTDLADVLTFSLLPYYEHHHKENKLVIGLVSGTNYLVLQDVRSFLDQFAFLDVRLVTEDSDDLDFLVTTFPKIIEVEEKPLFSVDSINHSDYQMNLFSLLQKAYKEKKHKLIL